MTTVFCPFKRCPKNKNGTCKADIIQMAVADYTDYFPYCPEHDQNGSPYEEKRRTK
jgi:hypothetical protein